MARQGFDIYKTFYPLPERFRLSDPVLVREVTGMEWPDFLDARERMVSEDVIDDIVLYGLAAVAFWQGNPDMSRERVKKNLEATWQEDVELIIEGDPEEADAVPPADGGVTPPETPARSSNGSHDETQQILVPDAV